MILFMAQHLLKALIKHKFISEDELATTSHIHDILWYLHSQNLLTTFDISESMKAILLNFFNVADRADIIVLINFFLEISQHDFLRTDVFPACIQYGQLDAITLLLSHGIIAEHSLETAVYARYPDIVKLLSEYGVDVTEPFSYQTQIMFIKDNVIHRFTNSVSLACYCHDLATIKLLVTYGADVQENDNVGLKYAILSNNMTITQYLLECGAGLTNNAIDLLRYVVKKNDSVEMMRLLLNHGLYLPDHLSDALYCAIIYQADKCVKLLEEQGGIISISHLIQYIHQHTIFEIHVFRTLVEHSQTDGNEYLTTDAKLRSSLMSHPLKIDFVIH